MTFLHAVTSFYQRYIKPSIKLPKSHKQERDPLQLASGDSTSNKTINETSDFESLTPEIRQMIINAATSELHVTYQIMGRPDETSPGWMLHMSKEQFGTVRSLLQVSRLISQDTTKVMELKGYETLVVDLRHDFVRNVPQSFNKTTDAVPPRLYRSARNLQITMPVVVNTESGWGDMEDPILWLLTLNIRRTDARSDSKWRLSSADWAQMLPRDPAETKQELLEAQPLIARTIEATIAKYLQGDLTAWRLAKFLDVIWSAGVTSEGMQGIILKEGMDDGSYDTRTWLVEESGTALSAWNEAVNSRRYLETLENNPWILDDDWQRTVPVTAADTQLAQDHPLNWMESWSSCMFSYWYSD